MHDSQNAFVQINIQESYVGEYIIIKMIGASPDINLELGSQSYGEYTEYKNDKDFFVCCVE